MCSSLLFPPPASSKATTGYIPIQNSQGKQWSCSCGKTLLRSDEYHSPPPPPSAPVAKTLTPPHFKTYLKKSITRIFTNSLSESVVAAAAAAAVVAQSWSCQNRISRYAWKKRRADNSSAADLWTTFLWEFVHHHHHHHHHLHLPPSFTT